MQGEQLGEPGSGDGRGSEGTEPRVHKKMEQRTHCPANNDPAQRSQETKESQISTHWFRINDGSHFQYMPGTLSFSFKLFLSDVQYTQLSPSRSMALSS